jgi:carbon storage regulator
MGDAVLILTRRADEAILIGDNIEILVMDIKGSQVRIGVTAPRDVTVDRKEVAERKAKEADARGNKWQWPAAGFRKAEPVGEVRTLVPGIDYDPDAVCPGCGCFRDRCACDLRETDSGVPKTSIPDQKKN